VFDCVGSAGSLAESLKWTAARGQVAMIGTGHGGRLDLTPLWFRELTIFGVYGRQEEAFHSRRIGTYSLVHELITEGKLDVAGLLTHTFRLDEYRKALAVALDKGAHGAIKVAFDLRETPSSK